ncbi:hypothetical protein [Thiorhodospira sibirica]|uniref:hypothetical protein n=1 Tax=Thiorhodospira sibirica TaxID=154347 RepID=UPI001C258F73|nr:hypothetical protein [Thiorhodospira sibirica]
MQRALIFCLLTGLGFAPAGLKALALDAPQDQAIPDQVTVDAPPAAEAVLPSEADEEAFAPPLDDNDAGALILPEAAEVPVEDPSRLADWVAQPGSKMIHLLERTRSGLHASTEWVARAIDGRFGDDPFEEGKGVSGSLGLNTLWREDRSLNTNLRLRARMDLPNLKDSTYLFFGLDNEEELVTDRPESFTRQDQLLEENRKQDQTRFAGLGYGLRENIDLRAGVRGGYKIYTQARYRKVWWLSDQDQIDFRETIFWTLDDRFGSTTALSYEHAYSPTVSLQWRNTGTVSEKSNGLAWASSVGFFKSFGDFRLLAVEALINGETDSRVDVAEYGLRTTWNQSLHEDWLLGRVSVGYFWPQKETDEERQQALAIGFGMELKF